MSRHRWTLAKLSLILPTVAAVSAVYGLLPYWFLTPRAETSTGRLAYLLYDMQGLVPVGYTLFAVALGVLAGTIWRRVLPAMAATLVGFVVARVAVGFARSSFGSPQERRLPVFAETNAPFEVVGDWVIGRSIHNAAGQKVSNAFAMCGSPSEAQRDGICAQLRPGDYNAEFFHQASQFWPFQLIETGIFVALAAVLLVLALHRIRGIT